MVYNGPDWNRTNGVSLRRRTLYPTEVQAQNALVMGCYNSVFDFARGANDTENYTRFAIAGGELCSDPPRVGEILHSVSGGLLLCALMSIAETLPSATHWWGRKEE